MFPKLKNLVFSLFLAAASASQSFAFTEFNKLVHEGTAFGKGTGVANYDDPTVPDHLKDELQTQNAAAANQTYQSLIDRELSQEITTTGGGATDPLDISTDVKYESAITSQNRDTAETIVVIGAAAVLPGPEDLVAGAILTSKTGQKLAEVVVINGQKYLQMAGGKVIDVLTETHRKPDIVTSKVEVGTLSKDGWSGKTDISKYKTETLDVTDSDREFYNSLERVERQKTNNKYELRKNISDILDKLNEVVQ